MGSRVATIAKVAGVAGLREYARHRKDRGLRGGTLRAVQKAIESGRIAEACTADGKIDVALADRLWSANTRPSMPSTSAGGKDQAADLPVGSPEAFDVEQLARNLQEDGVGVITIHPRDASQRAARAVSALIWQLASALPASLPREIEEVFFIDPTLTEE